jgi:hypothetical protein
MRRVVVQFWTSVDGYSCDEGTEAFWNWSTRPAEDP